MKAIIRFAAFALSTALQRVFYDHARELWAAFECVGCRLVFDVRTEHEALDVARCPSCGRSVGVRAVWPADDSGFGSRGDARWSV